VTLQEVQIKDWTTAKTLAENRKGIMDSIGYLATLATEEEAILAGIQAPGQGWIGASDATSGGKVGMGNWSLKEIVHFWDGNYEDNGTLPCDNLNGNCTAVTDPVTWTTNV